MEDQQIVPEPTKKFDFKLLALIAGAILLVLGIITGIIVGLSLIRGQQNTTPNPTPIPTMPATPTIVDIFPNANPRHASDSALLEIKANLQALNQQISTANFFEPEISPPNIDLTIEIK